MAYCYKCGKEIYEGASFCANCGNKINVAPSISSYEKKPYYANSYQEKAPSKTTYEENTYSYAENDTSITPYDGKNVTRFLLGFLGSFIVNHTILRPIGWKSRTCAYFFLGILTLGIYSIVASTSNFAFNAKQQANIGYKRKDK